MKLLDPKEKDFIHTALTLKVTCPARLYSDKLYCGEPSRGDLMDMEIFLGQISEHCQERWMFRRLYEDYRVRDGNYCAIRNDPTTQERDRKACKKTSARIAGWYQYVRKRTGAVRRFVGLR